MRWVNGFIDNINALILLSKTFVSNTDKIEVLKQLIKVWKYFQREQQPNNLHATQFHLCNNV